jgi:hypothetical protein
VGGFIGADTLSLMAVLLDFQQHEITLWNAGNLSPEALQSVHMDRAFVLSKTASDKFTFSVSVRLNDQVNTDLVIDTGADDTYVPADVIKQLKLKPQHRGHDSPTVFGTLKTNITRIKSLELGPFDLKDQDVEYADHAPAGYPPHIGMDILRQYRVLIDYPAKKMYLMPAPLQTSPTTESH